MTSAADMPAGGRDEELARVQRTFEAARSRMAMAQGTDEALDEVSNLLHHIYRLGELIKRRSNLSKTQLDEVLRQVPGSRGARWVRCFDTHDAAGLGELQDVYTDTFTDLYGDVVWLDLRGVPGFHPDSLGRSIDYANNLAGRGILDSTRPLFDEMTRLVRLP